MPARTLTLTPASKNGTAARAIQVVLYARVSSKDQEKEGFEYPGATPSPARLRHEKRAL